MLKDTLTAALAGAVAAARAAGDFAVESMPAPGIERPRDPAHGDFATNIAMVLAKSARMAPLKIAQAIAAQLPPGDLLEAVEVAPPGFINLRLNPKMLAANVATILREGPAYGRSRVGEGERVLLEYVSANPTGLLHVGHGRWAAVGSTLANVMRLAGFSVAQEFYINDAGNQMLLLGRSVEARLRQALGEAAEVPEEGYQGPEIVDVAQAVREQLGVAILDLPEDERVQRLTDFARDYLLAIQQKTLGQMATRFETWFSERDLHENGRVVGGIAHLRDAGHLYQQDGAWWLRSTTFGDDKDRVVVRDNGQSTYLAADIAYHRDKLERGFTRLVNILGADHHGYMLRLNAVVQALGGRPDTLQVILGQMVNLFRDGEPVRMSKRTGDMVTLQEVLDEVGVDAARFFLVMRSTDSTLDFDLALAKRETADNPVFYVQYAHARISSILRLASAAGPADGNTGYATDPASMAAAPLERLSEPDERALMLKLATYPDEIAGAALAMEPYRLARYAQELATAFHQFYTTCRVLGEDHDLTRARLALIVATRMVLRNVLEDVLGVSAPERMESTASV